MIDEDLQQEFRKINNLGSLVILLKRGEEFFTKEGSSSIEELFKHSQIGHIDDSEIVEEVNYLLKIR